MKSVGSLLWAAALILGVNAAKKLPTFVDYCHQDDPNLNECFKKALEQIRPHFIEGISELGLPPMNPLVLPEATLDANGIKVGFKNIRIYHFEDMQFQKVKIDLPKNHIEIDAFFPYLKIDFEYSFDGRLLLFTLASKGPGSANFSKSIVDLDYDGSRYQMKGAEHIKFDKRDVTFKIGKAELLFENLFENNKELTDQTNKIFNENSDSVIDELTPIIGLLLRRFIESVTDRAFSRHSIGELFPK